MTTENSSIASDVNCANGTLTSSELSDWLERQRFPALLVDRAVSPVWYIVGISGNTISAVIWLQRRMRRNNSSAVYLATLSINDTLFLLLHILQELKYAWQLRTVDFPGLCEAFAYIYLVTQYLAPILVLGFTVERFIAVCYPYEKSHFCTASRALKVSLSMIAGCLLLGSMQLYLWTYDGEECVVREAARHGDQTSLFAVWSWITEMLIFLAVPLFILVVNILVMREVCRMSSVAVEAALNKASHKASKSAVTNAMLLSVSFYVIFTTLPATLVYVLATVFPEPDPGLLGCTDVMTDPQWHRHIVYHTVRKIVDEMCMSHYACNFFLFFVTGLEFRLELRRTLRHCAGSSTVAEVGHKNGACSEYATVRHCTNSLKSGDEELQTFVSRV